MKKTTLFTFSLFIMIGAFAQSKDEAKYRKESEEMRKQIWAWDEPKFKVKDIPQQYANASKIMFTLKP